MRPIVDIAVRSPNLAHPGAYVVAQLKGYVESVLAVIHSV